MCFSRRHAFLAMINEAATLYETRIIMLYSHHGVGHGICKFTWRSIVRYNGGKTICALLPSLQNKGFLLCCSVRYVYYAYELRIYRRFNLPVQRVFKYNKDLFSVSELKYIPLIAIFVFCCQTGIFRPTFTNKLLYWYLIQEPSELFPLYNGILTRCNQTSNYFGNVKMDFWAFLLLMAVLDARRFYSTQRNNDYEMGRVNAFWYRLVSNNNMPGSFPTAMFMDVLWTFWQFVVIYETML